MPEQAANQVSDVPVPAAAHPAGLHSPQPEGHPRDQVSKRIYGLYAQYKMSMHRREHQVRRCCGSWQKR